MAYLDTSAVLAFLLPEPATALVTRAIAGTASSDRCLSPWTAVEVASALGIKVRMRALTAAEAATVLHAFRLDLRPACRLEVVEPSDFPAAEALLERIELGLRAGDALHLAVARRLGEPLLTLDRRMAAAAHRLGLQLVPI